MNCKLFSLVLLLTLSAKSFAGKLTECNSLSDNLTFSYKACINNNFKTVADKFHLDRTTCGVWTNDVDYVFQNCVNENFDEAKKKLGVSLDSCHNYDKDLAWYYKACINKNFQSVQAAMIKYDQAPKPKNKKP
jgi:hypothetical protein